MFVMLSDGMSCYVIWRLCYLTRCCRSGRPDKFYRVLLTNSDALTANLHCYKQKLLGLRPVRSTGRRSWKSRGCQGRCMKVYNSCTDPLLQQARTHKQAGNLIWAGCLVGSAHWFHWPSYLRCGAFSWYNTTGHLRAVLYECMWNTELSQLLVRMWAR